MNLTCMAREFAAAVAAVAAATEKGVDTPVLRTTRIEVSGGKATLIATNMDIAVRTSLAAEGSGTVHLNALSLANKAAALAPDKPVLIEDDGPGFVRMSQGRTRWKIPVVPAEGWPDGVGDAVAGSVMMVGAAQFLAALGVCAPAAETTPTRAYLQGIRLDTGSGLHLVATNGRAMHCQAIHCTATTRAATVPMATVGAIAKLFRAAETLAITITEDAIAIYGGNTLLRSKLVDGAFPEWRRLIPTHPHGITAQAGELKRALARATAVALDKEGGIRIRLAIRDGEVQIEAVARDGETGAAVAAATTSDADVEWRGYSSLLAAALGTMGDGPMTLEYRDGGAPLVLRQGDAENFRLVMPIG